MKYFGLPEAEVAPSEKQTACIELQPYKSNGRFGPVV